MDPVQEASIRKGMVLFSLVAGVGGTAVGLFVIVYGLFFWPSTALLPSVAPIASGTVVLVGTAWGAWLLRRTSRRRLTSVRLTPEGIQGSMADGTLVNADWNDPGFALDITSTSVRSSAGPAHYSLRWVRSPGAYAREISSTGLNHLLESARAHGLVVSETSTTTGRFTTQTSRIRASNRGV